MTYPAIGYLRKDISGHRQHVDELALRFRARRLGYSLSKTIVFGEHVDDPVFRLINVISQARVRPDAVLTPSLDHFGGVVPAKLVREVELITLEPEASYDRHTTL